MNLLAVKGLSILATVIYGLMMLQYSQKIVTLKVNKYLAMMVAVAVSILFGFLSFQEIPYYVTYTFMYIVFILCYTFGFSGKMIAFLFASGNFIFHLLCLKGLIVTLTSIVMKTSMFQVIENPIVRSITTIILFVSASIFLLGFRLVFTEEKVNLLVKDTSQVKLITTIQGVLNIVLIFATLIYYYEIDIVWITVYHLQLSIMMVIGFYILFHNCVATCLQKEFKEKEESMKYQIQSQLEQYEIQSRYIKDLRRIKHDYNNQIKGLGYILESNDWQKAKEYVKELGVEINASNLTYVQFSNNNLIDAILQDINTKAQEHGIVFKARVQGESLPFTDLEICTIFSNLMNNALEATAKIKKSLRFIEITSNEVNGFLVIKIENSFDGQLKLANGKLQTLKKNAKQHGIGVQSVERILHEHKGNVEIRTNLETKVFQVFLFIPVREDAS